MNWQGSTLGNYQIEYLLGSGAFADVYLGKHCYLKTSAAIKILHTRLDERDLQHFLEEAQTVAGLIHPHIVRVLEFGVENQTPYLIMDYAPSGTLRQRYPRPTRLTVSECVTYMNQAASALQYAHDHRIIHRDVKPENMLLDLQERLLLSDFGISIAAQSSRSQGQQEFGGTAAYSSPEQIQGKASYTSDQYALGILLYEWLTGELPFRGSFFEVCGQHLFQPAPSLLEHVPNLPPAIEQVYQRAVAKDAQQRFVQIEDFARALEMAHRGDSSAVLFTAVLSTSAVPDLPYVSPILAEASAARATSSFSSSSWVEKGRASTPVFRPVFPPAPVVRWGTKRNPALSVLVGVLLVLLLVSGILGYTHQTEANNHIAAPEPSPQFSQATSTPDSSSNTPDVTPAPTAAPQVAVLVADGTIQIQKMLTCDNCDDPVHVRIDAVTVQHSNGRMIWTLTFINVSGASVSLDWPTLSLHDPTSAQDFSPASLRDSDGSCDPYFDTSWDCSAIFAFLPYTQTTYTLNVEIQDMYNSFDVSFVPLEVTFS
jgi:serine/threonine protein kinase